MNHEASRPRRRAQHNVLEVRVMSPRLAWIGLARFTGKLIKIACVLAALTGIGWSVWRGVQHTFHHNPDFNLKLIDLNENPILDEAGLVQLAGINLSRNPSLFEVNVEQTRLKLMALPAIMDAKVERHLPDTLLVRIKARNPKAWIAETGSETEELRKEGGMLVDATGHVYPCPVLQLEEAKTLPILLVTPNPDRPITAGQALDHPELEHCFNLLESIRKADPESTHWIQTIRQANAWSLRLVTRQGTSATFGLTSHDRQINKLRAALNHAAARGYQIDTINLIPKFNVPITLRGQNTPPRAIPVSEHQGDSSSESLSSLLERH